MAGKSMTMAEKLAMKVQPLREEGSAPAPAEKSAPVIPITTPEETVPPAEPSAVESAPRAKAPRKQRATVSSAPKAESDGAPTDTVSAVITIRKDIDARLMAFRKKTRKSHPVILFDAIEATYDRLPDLVRTALGKESDPAPVKKLFDRSARTDTPITTEDSVDRVDHTVRLTRANRELLSQIADEVGAPSRTFMMELAYDAYLPKD